MFGGYGGFAAASWPRDLEDKVELSEMREIDSTHNSEVRLRQALRSLSASSPAEAPPQVGDVLAGAFRRHHARRRAVRRSAIAAVVCLVLPALVLLMVTERHRKSTPGPDTIIASPPHKTPTQPVAVASPLPVRAKKSHATSGRPVPTAASVDVAVSDGFVDLPTSDQAVRGEDLRVVRLEVTGRALQLVGAPVTEESADNRMLADFIVGQDGTPYAVRLVR
jgi:hypothetical protein